MIVPPANEANKALPSCRDVRSSTAAIEGIGAGNGMQAPTPSIDSVVKPSVLYHGSPYRFDEALPSFMTPITDLVCRSGVYASCDRRIGLAFALKYRSMEPESFQRARLWRDQGEIFVAVGAQSIDWEGESFLYHMSPMTFYALNGWEWVSPSRVVPIVRETVFARDFLQRVAEVGDDVICMVNEHFRNPLPSGIDERLFVDTLIA